MVSVLGASRLWEPCRWQRPLPRLPEARNLLRVHWLPATRRVFNVGLWGGREAHGVQVLFQHEALALLRGELSARGLRRKRSAGQLPSHGLLSLGSQFEAQGAHTEHLHNPQQTACTSCDQGLLVSYFSGGVNVRLLQICSMYVLSPESTGLVAPAAWTCSTTACLLPHGFGCIAECCSLMQGPRCACQRVRPVRAAAGGAGAHGGQ